MKAKLELSWLVRLPLPPPWLGFFIYSVKTWTKVVSRKELHDPLCDNLMIDFAQS